MCIRDRVLPQKEILNKAVELIPAVKDNTPDPEKVTDILKGETKEIIDETIDKAVDKKD